MTPLKINNTSKPIEMWIPRDKFLAIPKFVFINTSSSINNTIIGPNMPNDSILFNNSYYLTGFYIKRNFSSIYINLKPLNSFQIGYVVLLNFGRVPFPDDYDLFKVYCPNGN
jgi:hypothetical protein